MIRDHKGRVVMCEFQFFSFVADIGNQDLLHISGYDLMSHPNLVEMEHLEGTKVLYPCR